MIFKRPNAFIIKHLKMIHAIILVCLAYSLVRTSSISSQYTYIVKVKSIIGESYTTELYNVRMFLILLIGLALTVIILLLLIKKKKKFIFYILLTALFVGTLVFYIMSYSNIATMQKNAVSARTYLAYSDFSRILFYIQSVFVFIVLFKATGFDIKNLSFGKVSGIDLTEDDSEEIEFNLELDGNELRTKQRRKIRELKYKYLENKPRVNLAITALVLIILTIGLITTNSKKEVYSSLGNELSTQKYSVVVKDAYLTNVTSSDRVDNSGIFVILTMKLKKNIEAEYKFNYSNISLEMNGKSYHASPKYFEYFSDFGDAYKEQNLTQDYKDYYLVYQLPYESVFNDVIILVSSDFNYETNKYNYYKIKATYQKMDKLEEITHDYNFKETMEIDAYGVKNNIVINEFEVQNKYKISVDEEINGKNYKLVEYLVPTASDNEEKTIMRINYESDDAATITFASILSKYAIIEYDIDNTKKEGKIYAFLSPKLTKQPDTYYIQVSKEVLKGKNRCIKITVRNQTYRYYLDNKEEL